MLEIATLEKLDTKQLEQLRTLTDPLRLRLFTEFRTQKTVTEAATALGMERKSLYYQLRILVKTGLVEKVETRQVGHLLESVYKAVDRLDFTHRDSRKPGPMEPYHQLVMGIAQATSEDCYGSLSRGGELRSAAARQILKIKSENLSTTPRRISELMREFMEKVMEFEEEDGDVDYSVTITHFEM